MAVPLLVADQVMCEHGGKVVMTSSVPTAQILGIPMVTDTDVKMSQIVGCPHTIPGTNPPIPKPCLKVVDTGKLGIKDATCPNGLMADADKVSTVKTDNGVSLKLAGTPLAQSVCM